tara:strand:- start:285 stop:686 length:402 start_codon:yes stop_codon:yes gene_type:complete
MRNIYPEYFYDKRLIEQCENFVVEGKYSFEELEADDKEDLVAMLLEVMGEESYVGLVESDNLHLIMHNIKMFLRTADRQYSKDLMEVCRESVKEYYLPMLEELYNSISEEDFNTRIMTIPNIFPMFRKKASVA